MRHGLTVRQPSIERSSASTGGAIDWDKALRLTLVRLNERAEDSEKLPRASGSLGLGTGVVSVLVPSGAAST